MKKEGTHIAYVTVPKDLSQVKTKFLFNLTKRQVICFGCGILIGLPLFFILRDVLPPAAAAFIMIVVMMPFFLFGLYEKNGEPLEKILRHIYEARFKRPMQRPYQTNNFYTALIRQAKLDKEVHRIAQGR